jgi:hypothetical protein
MPYRRSCPCFLRRALTCGFVGVVVYFARYQEERALSAVESPPRTFHRRHPEIELDHRTAPGPPGTTGEGTRYVRAPRRRGPPHTPRAPRIRTGPRRTSGHGYGSPSYLGRPGIVPPSAPTRTPQSDAPLCGTAATTCLPYADQAQRDRARRHRCLERDSADLARRSSGPAYEATKRRSQPQKREALVL